MRTIYLICVLFVFVDGRYAYPNEQEIVLSRHATGEKNLVITLLQPSNVLQRGYHQNGQLRFQQRIVDGYEEGEYLSWFANGQLSVSGQYRKGKPFGTFTYYREDGTVSGIRLFAEAGERLTAYAKQLAEDAQPPQPLPSYHEVFRLIAQAYHLSEESEALLKLAAESILRKHQGVGKYTETISIEPQYYWQTSGWIRGAQNGGSFYIFGRTDTTYEHIGTLEGGRLQAGTLNNRLMFYTYLHWSAAEEVETQYQWNGRRFIQVEQKLYRYGENRKRIFIEDWMKHEEVQLPQIEE